MCGWWNRLLFILVALVPKTCQQTSCRCPDDNNSLCLCVLLDLCINSRINTNGGFLKVPRLVIPYFTQQYFIQINTLTIKTYLGLEEYPKPVKVLMYVVIQT